MKIAIDKWKLYRISKKLLMLSKAVKKLDIDDINEIYSRGCDSVTGVSFAFYDWETKISHLMEWYNLDEFDAEILDILLRDVK